MSHIAEKQQQFTLVHPIIRIVVNNANSIPMSLSEHISPDVGAIKDETDRLRWLNELSFPAKHIMSHCLNVIVFHVS